MKIKLVLCATLLLPFSALAQESNETVTKREGRYMVVDTGQVKFFDNTHEITKPNIQSKFYGQDAQFVGNQPSYTDNGDGTVTDNVTGLEWQKNYEVMSYDEALQRLKNFSLGGKSDWRLPTIKEAYSLIMLSGVDLSPTQMQGVNNGVPFINTDYFDFDYGSNGDRDIDVQILSSTIYKGTTMGRAETVFGVNVADGRIKGYPVMDPRSRSGKKFTVRFVRGNPEYGKNNFVDNNDGTISDKATGLMWQKDDSRSGMNWQEALEWVKDKNRENYLGYGDWRLPNVKELQSIVDYSRSPQDTSSAAINPIFDISSIKDEGGNTNYPFFWSSTTHKNGRNASAAAYVCFGEGLGFFSRPGRGGMEGGRQNGMMRPPHGGRNDRPQPRGRMMGEHQQGRPSLDRMQGEDNRGGTLMDVHGAGAQRSDPKTGDSSNFPNGRGPQGDVIRIDNFVRMVR